MGIRNEIKKAIEEDKLYDFVRNESYRMSKDELTELVCQLDFTAYQYSCTRKLDRDDYHKAVIENLNDYDFFNEEE